LLFRRYLEHLPLHFFFFFFQGFLDAAAQQKVFILCEEILGLMVESMVGVNEVYELSGYLQDIGKRQSSLRESATKIEERIFAISQDIDRKKVIFESSMRGLKEDVGALKDDVREVQKSILLVIADLKSTLKRDDFKRFERRLELWAPESRISKQETMRVLDRAL
jgi:hypothetical protein